MNTTPEHQHPTLLARIAGWYTTSALVLMGCLVLFAAINLGASLFEFVDLDAGLSDFDYAPYRMMKPFGARWPVNGDGFRAPPLKELAQSAEEHFTIVFVGGSVCMGFGGNNGPP